MWCNWLKGLRKYVIGTCVALAVNASVARAGDDDMTEMKKKLEQQQQQIEELRQRLTGGDTEASEAGADGKDGKKKAELPKGKYVIDKASIENIVRDYLKDNPGAGMPSGVQTGYYGGQGFTIKSAPNPSYANWSDESKIPFEMRIRGRLQIPYYFYKVTDTLNHLTGVQNIVNGKPKLTANDFSQIEVKRMRLNFGGTAFSPNLRYFIELDGTTRGIAGLAGGNGLAGGGNGAATVDHAMRLFQGWVAYDFRPCCFSKGCGDECCCEDNPKYAPTFTIMAGKYKPYFTFEEWQGSGNQQFVEYGMTTWFFDSDDDNLATGAGFQVKAAEDRFFTQFMVNNGEETQIAALQMDRLPGIVWGGHYDFGGDWDCEKHQWILYGDSPSDLDWHCHPVVRVGGAFYAAWNDRRSLYTNAELNRIRVLPGAPNGGTNIVSLLNGGSQGSGFSLDAVDDYRYEAFVAGKWRGFSFANDWFLRNLDNFRGQHVGVNAAGNVAGNNHLDNAILYNAGNTLAAFPRNHGLIDYGTQFQTGYFLIPKKLEVAARFGWIRGDSGNIFGNSRRATNIRIPGTTPATQNVAQFPNEFNSYTDAFEYTAGVNYFWKRNNLKWQTDVGCYNNNPASGGQSPTGFIPGSNGYLLRTQIQLWF